MLLNCGVGEDSWESLGLQRGQTSQFWRKSILNIHWKTEAPILWSPNAKRWLIRKDPDARKDWRQEEKRMIEDEMVEWHHRLNGHEFEWTLGIGEGQEGLACCDSWVGKESDTISDWTELILAQRIPWTEENGGLQSMGSKRVRYDWRTNTCFTFSL